VKVKLSATGLDKPLEFQEVEAPEFLDRKVVRSSPLRTGRLYPQEVFLVVVLIINVVQWYALSSAGKCSVPCDTPVFIVVSLEVPAVASRRINVAVRNVTSAFRRNVLPFSPGCNHNLSVDCQVDIDSGLSFPSVP
jgi:hypothetical protein